MIKDAMELFVNGQFGLFILCISIIFTLQLILFMCKVERRNNRSKRKKKINTQYVISTAVAATTANGVKHNNPEENNQQPTAPNLPPLPPPTPPPLDPEDTLYNVTSIIPDNEVSIFVTDSRTLLPTSMAEHNINNITSDHPSPIPEISNSNSS